MKEQAPPAGLINELAQNFLIGILGSAQSRSVKQDEVDACVNYAFQVADTFAAKMLKDPPPPPTQSPVVETVAPVVTASTEVADASKTQAQQQQGQKSAAETKPDATATIADAMKVPELPKLP